MDYNEIKKYLKHDKPEGNGLDKIDGLFEFDEVTNAVQLKKRHIHVVY